MAMNNRGGRRGRRSGQIPARTVPRGPVRGAFGPARGRPWSHKRALRSREKACLSLRRGGLRNREAGGDDCPRGRVLEESPEGHMALTSRLRRLERALVTTDATTGALARRCPTCRDGTTRRSITAFDGG